MHRSINVFQLLLILSLAGIVSPPAREAHAAYIASLAPIAYVAPDGDDTHDCATPATRCATLRRGLDQIADGGELRLSSGIYTGTAEIIRSATISGGYALPDFSPGASATVLDGQRMGTTLSIAGAVSVRLTRMTITGGVADSAGNSSGRGGGLSIRDANVILDHVEVRDNIADSGGSGRGGGIYIRDGSLMLFASAVMSNTAALLTTTTSIPPAQLDMPPLELSDTIVGRGGGIYALNARLAIRQSTLATNSAVEDKLGMATPTRGWGGAVYAYNCTLDTLDTLFMGNHALATLGGGGAIELLDSQARLRGGEISENQAGQVDGTAGGGGGLDIISGTTTLINVALRRNLAASGGGIRLQQSNDSYTTAALTLTNILLAEHGSAAVALPSSSNGPTHAEVRHTTLISNSVGLLAGAGQSISVTNSLLVGNDIAAQALDGGSVSLSYTNRYGNLLAGAGDIEIGPAGDLALRPEFAPGDPAFRLALGSPLLDLGLPIEGIGSDFEGQPRSFDGDGDGVARPDLGWDELVRSAAVFGPNQTRFATPGETLTTTLELRNMGLAGDVFQLSIAAPERWGASVQPRQVALGPRTRASLIIEIHVPAGTPLNSQTVLTVHAAGQTSAAEATILVAVGSP